MVDSDSSKVLLISVKPKYLEKILNKSKTVELRKSKPKVAENDIIIFYATTPVKAILGYAYIQNILKGTPEEIWETTHEYNGLTKSEFLSYYNNSSRAYGIKIKDTETLKKSLKLKELKNIIPGFHPPQTYKYLSKEIFYDELVGRV